MSLVTISKRESINSKTVLKNIKEGIQGFKTGLKIYSQSLSHITPIFAYPIQAQVELEIANIAKHIRIKSESMSMSKSSANTTPLKFEINENSIVITYPETD